MSMKKSIDIKFPEDNYNLWIMDYHPEFMKLFYNSIDLNKIASMAIIFDFNDNNVDWFPSHNDAYPTIFIRSVDNKDHYQESDLIVFQIEDYIEI